MLAQRVEMCGGEDLIAFRDSGLQVMMLTHRKAEVAGLMPKAATHPARQGVQEQGPAAGH
jgi:hypothetical protein